MPYLKQLQKAHQIEVLGEAAYRAAARVARMTARVHQWRTLMKLETQTKKRVESAIAALGGPVTARKVDVWVGFAIGGLLALLPWSVSLKALRAITDHAVEFWEELARTHTGRDNVLHEYLIAHEKAQCDFARIALEGNTDEAMQPVYRLLDV